MNDITVLSPEKLAEIRQRYSPKPIPKCRICGAEMSIGAVSASRTVYACSGATHDENGWHYAPGRSLADDHYSESRVTVVDVSDPDVLALVEALEKAQGSNEFLKNQLSELANFNPDWDKLEASYESWREIAAELLVAKDRIADLESRTVTVKLPDEVLRLAQAPQHLSKHDQLCWMSGANWMRMEVVKLNPAAGIQVIEGEGQCGAE